MACSYIWQALPASFWTIAMSPSNTETAADLLSAFLAKAKYSSASDSFPASRKARATATTNSGFFLFFPFNNCPASSEACAGLT